MSVNIHPNWKTQLQQEFEQPYFQSLTNFVKNEYAQHTCYPKGADIFAAFDHCPFDQTKVVIIGQDPYHGPGQANGLCFSVKDGIPHPPSLINIFREIQTDLDIPYPKSGNLERWAKQGVLLLNATLTVRAHEAGSHQGKGWETFTDAVIKKAIPREARFGIFTLGRIRKKETSFNRRQKASYPDFRASFPAKCE